MTEYDNRGIFLPKSAQKAGFGYGKTGNALKNRDLSMEKTGNALKKRDLGCGKTGNALKKLGIEVENFGIAPKILDRVEIMILY